MITTPLLLSLVAYADTTDLAQRVQIHLSAAAQPWLTRNGRKIRKAVPTSVDIVYELEVNRSGGVTGVRPSLSSGKKNADRLARDLFRVLPRLDPPDEVRGAERNTPCVVHLRLRGRPRGVDIAVACMPVNGGAPEVAHREDVKLRPPIAELFRGWELEATGDSTQALAEYRAASKAAPHWHLASLAVGLTLARSGRLGEARPHLKMATRKCKPTPEVRRYLTGKDAPQQGVANEADVDGEADVSSCQRDESEIFHHVRRSFGKISRCVDAEQKRSPTVVLPSALPISFVITPAGPIRHISVEHRHYREGPFPRCVEKALTARLKARPGSACPVHFELEVTTGYAP